MPVARHSRRRRIAGLAVAALLAGTALATVGSAPAHAALSVCSGGTRGYVTAPTRNLLDGYIIIWTGERCFSGPTTLV